jgi:hypothetical protein
MEQSRHAGRARSWQVGGCPRFNHRRPRPCTDLEHDGLSLSNGFEPCNLYNATAQGPAELRCLLQGYGTSDLRQRPRIEFSGYGLLKSSADFERPRRGNAFPGDHSWRSASHSWTHLSTREQGEGATCSSATDCDSRRSSRHPNSPGRVAGDDADVREHRHTAGVQSAQEGVGTLRGDRHEQPA